MKKSSFILYLAFLLLSCTNAPENNGVTPPTAPPAPAETQAPAPPKEAAEIPKQDPAPVSVKVKSSNLPAADKPAEKVKTVAAPEMPEAVNPGSPDHSAWNRLLQQYVSATGKVNYAGMKQDLPKLEAYLKTLADNPVRNDWPKTAKMAYWINAYNAFTIKLILDHYPVNSIMDIHGGKPWDVKWIQLGDQTYSLNQIENDILRPRFKDPRIHFALNCAAQSCPPLLNRAWTTGNLDQELNEQTRKFINNPAFNRISGDPIAISRIFDWYGSDFGDRIAFLNQYAGSKISPTAAVGFQEYNWALNN